MNLKILSRQKEYAHARGSFSLLLLLLLSLLILWCMNKYVFSFNFIMLISYVVDIFFIRMCLWCFYCQDIFFLFKKSACYHIKNKIKKIWFSSSLDADLSFSQIKKLICIFIRCRSKFFSNKKKKMICIFIRCRF